MDFADFARAVRAVENEQDTLEVVTNTFFIEFIEKLDLKIQFLTLPVPWFTTTISDGNGPRGATSKFIIFFRIL